MPKFNYTNNCTHLYSYIFFFNHTATTEIYTLSLHDALPIFISGWDQLVIAGGVESMSRVPIGSDGGAMAMDPYTNYQDRKSTRLNSSHMSISYAVFCLKKKKKKFIKDICYLKL